MSSGTKYQWFRCYSEIVDDEKMRLLAFEDRWHFIALLCCKSTGVIDEAGPLMRRKVAVKLGIDLMTLDEVARRLAEVGLIDRESLQPIAWDRRQFTSDSSAERTRAYRARLKRHCDVTVTPPETETEADTDTEEEKQKAARARVSRPDGVTELVWSDFLAIRRAKKSPLTATALAGIEREAAKAGVTLSQALATCCERGWVGFRADWIAQPARGSPKRSAAVEAGLALAGYGKSRAEVIDV